MGKSAPVEVGRLQIFCCDKLKFECFFFQNQKKIKQNEDTKPKVIGEIQITKETTKETSEYYPSIISLNEKGILLYVCLLKNTSCLRSVARCGSEFRKSL